MSYEDGSHYIHLASRMLFRSSLRTWVLICLRFIADLSLFVSLGPRYRIECCPYVTVLNLGK